MSADTSESTSGAASGSRHRAFVTDRRDVRSLLASAWDDAVALSEPDLSGADFPGFAAVEVRVYYRESFLPPSHDPGETAADDDPVHLTPPDSTGEEGERRPLANSTAGEEPRRYAHFGSVDEALPRGDR